MDIDWDNDKRDYKILLNWGVFEDENDTGPSNRSTIYGAKYMRDVIDWKFNEPRASIQNLAIYSSLIVASLVVLMNWQFALDKFYQS